ncbi:Rhodanese-related sulfurtransferase [Desulfocapsa sulfexigens DSM 10523]|uniref:Rhodanese-related sulfurtransferase n=2 Tax=Desulfocapsa TaxID=53318 RepID=M1P671_DESSD|nr:Rhodanese-related sulfurtransferase [Desulfocapsa sulfexigens DSM 10523]
MKKLTLLLLSFLLLCAALPAIAGEVPLISKDELKAQLDSGNVVILDVRSGRDWSSSEFKIKGAVQAPGSDIAKWSKDYTKDQPLVLYCA